MIKRLRTGDIVRARVKTKPFIFHVGIVVEEDDGVYVWHNIPDEYNSDGGNVVKCSIDDYLANRIITYVVSTGLAKEQIEQAAQSLSHEKFSWWRNNCECFVNEVRYGFKSSPQQTWWIFAVGVVSAWGLAYYVFGHKKSGA